MKSPYTQNQQRSTPPRLPWLVGFELPFEAGRIYSSTVKGPHVQHDIDSTCKQQRANHSWPAAAALAALVVAAAISPQPLIQQASATPPTSHIETHIDGSAAQVRSLDDALSIDVGLSRAEFMDQATLSERLAVLDERWSAQYPEAYGGVSIERTEGHVAIVNDAPNSLSLTAQALVYGLIVSSAQQSKNTLTEIVQHARNEAASFGNEHAVIGAKLDTESGVVTVVVDQQSHRAGSEAAEAAKAAAKSVGGSGTSPQVIVASDRMTPMQFGSSESFPMFGSVADMIYTDHGVTNPTSTASSTHISNTSTPTSAATHSTSTTATDTTTTAGTTTTTTTTTTTPEETKVLGGTRYRVLNDPYAALCSLGFAGSYRGTAVNVTAAHCNNLHDGMDSGHRTFLDNTDSPFGEFSPIDGINTVDDELDIALLTINDEREARFNHPYIQGDGDAIGITGDLKPVPGTTVCKSGYRSGYLCGTVEHNEGMTPGQLYITMCGLPGDSGGVVFAGTKAVGVSSKTNAGSYTQCESAESGLSKLNRVPRIIAVPITDALDRFPGLTLTTQ